MADMADSYENGYATIVYWEVNGDKLTLEQVKELYPESYIRAQAAWDLAEEFPGLEPKRMFRRSLEMDGFRPVTGYEVGVRHTGAVLGGGNRP